MCNLVDPMRTFKNAIPSHALQVFAIAILASLSGYLTHKLQELSQSHTQSVKPTPQERPLSSYSWIGGDHPRHLPVGEQPYIKVVVQESVHYDIDAPESDEEWHWTNTFGGDGHVRLGEQKRMFAVAMFHELHCVRAIRGVIIHGWQSIDKKRQSHIHHCFNYLRQYFLCAADTTLERGDFASRNLSTKRVTATHTCRDWGSAYDTMYQKWKEWEEYRMEHGIPEHDDVSR